MKKIAVIGAGISGLSIARLLIEKNYDVTVFEKEQTPGGLVRCNKINDNIFHLCGGHVFNTKREDVLEWFWRIMPQEEFSNIKRNSVVMFDEQKRIPYPIEDHFYLLSLDEQIAIIQDLLSANKTIPADNFDQFLYNTFGKTLYNLYFRPYNNKVWQQDLRMIPIAWLDGKLPVSDNTKILFNNINRVEEKSFVHSSFWYNKTFGSQRIADILANETKICYGIDVEKTVYSAGEWIVNGNCFDVIIFCGNIKQLPTFIEGVDISPFAQEIENLTYHGTTSVFCEIDSNPYSWIYLPCEEYRCHRIICTGNFKHKSTNGIRTTATIEFTNQVTFEEIISNLQITPLHPTYINHAFNKYTYPVQNMSSRSMIKTLKEKLALKRFFLLGRFAEWEYYNMDAAMGSAIDLSNHFIL